MNHEFSSFQLTKGYFRTMGDMTKRNIGKVRVLLVNVKYTYLSTMLYSEIPQDVEVNCLNVVGSPGIPVS